MTTGPPSSKRPNPFIENWKRSLLAVLAGNVLYYAVERHLPAVAQHNLYKVDWGLGVNFVCCVLCYFVVRLIW